MLRMGGGPEVARLPHRFTHVIPALVAGIQSAAGCSACGWMYPGDKPRDDSRAVRGAPSPHAGGMTSSLFTLHVFDMTS